LRSACDGGRGRRQAGLIARTGRTLKGQVIFTCPFHF
jgi:hypothetical protein